MALEEVLAAMGLVSRPLIGLATALDRRIGWDHIRPRIVALFVLDGLRERLRRENLYDTGLPAQTPPRPSEVNARTIDGSWNDLERPRAGSVGTRFGRNVPRRRWAPETEPMLLEPSPREVSRKLLTRTSFVPAKSLNVLAAAWIQFEVHDWVRHEPDTSAPRYEIPLEEDDPFGQTMRVYRAQVDPTSLDPGSTPAFLTNASGWWDGSQIYGSDARFARHVRTDKGGKLRIDEDLLPPDDLVPREDPGVAENLWVGLGLLHVLFMREHNAICDCLRQSYPSWSDDRLYDTARLVNAAVMAKIHTVEWTTAIIAHPTTIRGMRASWYGILGERFTNRFGRVGKGALLSGIPGSRTEDHRVLFSLTEEFVAVYRMHPLLPDDFIFRSAADGKVKAEYPFSELGLPKTRERLLEIGVADAFYSLGIAYPGALVLHNYPKALQSLSRLDPKQPLVDLATIDILRTREAGVPRYNEFRRLFHLKPAESFLEVTGDPDEAARLEDVYGDVERIDLMVGLYAERRPEGFAFGETAFRVFLLMASRRLLSDRFFTNDFTPAMYTPEGLQWIRDATMVKVLLRHYPELEPRLRGVKNAFHPWDPVPS